MSTTLVNETALLFDQIVRWSREEGWDARQALDCAENRDDLGQGEYAVVEISTLSGDNRTPAGNIEIRPAGIQYDGRVVVDVVAWPTLIRVRLMHTPGTSHWEMTTDAGVPFRQEWNKSNFVRLIRDILTTW